MENDLWDQKTCQALEDDVHFYFKLEIQEDCLQYFCKSLGLGKSLFILDFIEI